MIRRLLPKSLLGQMLLAVAVALLVAQALSAVLLYRADQQRREMGVANALAFQLIAGPLAAGPRGLSERGPGERGQFRGRGRWHGLGIEYSPASPLRPGEAREPAREQRLRTILAQQGIEPAELIVTRRQLAEDPYSLARIGRPGEWRRIGEPGERELLVAALRREGDSRFAIARIPLGNGGNFRRLSALILQTFVLYAVLVGGLALLLRRITRPLAALTRRVESFAGTREPIGALEPSGPQDTRRLIAAHNAMEARIAALLDEKNVMLGAIGHDLKTPLAALRVRIESVADAGERAKMAATIEDITKSLDDILSLARVGRPDDELERTELAALVASVVEEFEDMGEPVELAASERMALEIRTTWLRRALRNLIGNALRYGDRARVSLVRTGSEAVIRIEDDGPGIPASEIGAMFEPFVRGEASRNRETGGAGLGLTLARAIADQHGGTLVLANREGAGGEIEGLTAELRLPLESGFASTR